MYDPLSEYTNSGISENPTYFSNAFHVSGFAVLDWANVIVPPFEGKLPVVP